MPGSVGMVLRRVSGFQLFVDVQSSPSSPPPCFIPPLIPGALIHRPSAVLLPEFCASHSQQRWPPVEIPLPCEVHHSSVLHRCANVLDCSPLLSHSLCLGGAYIFYFVIVILVECWEGKEMNTCGQSVMINLKFTCT